MEELKCAAGLNRRRRKGKPAFLFGAELDQWDLFLWIMEVHCPPPKKETFCFKVCCKEKGREVEAGNPKGVGLPFLLDPAAEYRPIIMIYLRTPLQMFLLFHIP